MIKIVGDINYTDGYFDVGFGIGSRLRKGYNPFENIVFEDKDYWIGNFEGVASNISDKEGVKKKQFRIEKKFLKHLVHFNLYNVSNNHIMQHGEVAYNETIRAIKEFGSDYVGDNNRRTVKFTHKDYSVGVLSFSQRDEKFVVPPSYWYQPEYFEIQKEFQNIKECDLKIAYIHWGCEFMNSPYLDQIQFARWLVDLGFNLVVGLHPHVLQGYEKYKSSYIFYSLGNFLFNMPTEETKISAILNVDYVDDEVKVSYEYTKVKEDLKVYFLREEEVPETIRFNYLNKLLNRVEENELYFKNLIKRERIFQKKNRLFILSSIMKFKYSLLDFSSIFFGFLKRKLK